MNIEYIARAVIKEDGKILLCHGKENENWFFPGGHIEEGESAPAALAREIKEELGVGSEVCRFVGASENKFTRAGVVSHEINLVFEVSLDENEVVSIEDHIEFAWLTPEEMQNTSILPASLRDAVLVVQKENRPLWASEGF